ncbi:MAG: hypothetical protein A3G32_04280 [Deltaproteobacteria bacterium RIFCSPLOWO2_12_FULL_40_28]|nr:MAG: hypothetical protein A3C45_08390 [Deltaproteobacteria bacterium RIFCSPHIGHO2_02_FULL_40_28]OGQ19588.1 MAG: hypothetical protein A3E27_07585 [Deltaproteobacteria bacterium RIFCSPHIGHO2_12_FULL_40_32]OGQ40865.1 MAG: hypothetical protein A3I69_03000 [Deltaproteobacteria bacterium RIFCSPLOWO2_02_FULL_40_36]OGQ53980.1 MAG: hypothetical protein A3G32_04280 [Deltaproteobacteria bacterium RIFCSPLOWO2_12_FULL_40_28]
MKIVIFGLGSIGLRHAGLLKEYGGHEIVAFRTLGSKNAINLKEIFSWDELDQFKPELAVICNPTSLHIKTAIECVKRGVFLFLEKPIGSSEEGLDELVELVQAKKLTTYVAYILRFHPAIAELKEKIRKEKLLHCRMVCSSFLPDWRKGSDYKKSYSASKKEGGGVLLDLSHELDMADYLFNGVKTIEGKLGKASSLTVDSEDYADLILSTSACPVSIHLNYFSHQTKRSIFIDTESNVFEVDLISGDRDALYKRQWDYFFDNIRNPKMMNNLIEAAPLFKQMIHFKEKAL